MRWILALIAIFLLGVGIYFVAQEQGAAPEGPAVGTPAGMQRFSSAEYGISFSYPDAYVLQEMDAPGSGQRRHHVITLTRKEDLPPPVNGEGPTAITIEMYQNDLDKQTTEEWIRNTSASNWKLGEGRLSELTVSGLPALSYRWSGLYEGTTVALAQPKWVYVFTVTYLEMGADIVQDFVAIRESVQIAD